MPEIRLGGTPDNVLASMMIVKATIQRRKDEGWQLFQDDEEWNYRTQSDERVCNVCRGYAGRWIGSQIPVEFPDYKVWDKAHVKPGTHIYFPHLKWANAPDAYGGCRCNLYWADFLYTLLIRLDQELKQNIITTIESWGFRRT